jgi:hypothetical protein
MVLCGIGIQTLDMLQRYLLTELPTSSPNFSSLWLGGLTYHPVYYLRIYNSLIGSAHLCQLYREERKFHLTGVVIGTDPSDEKAACNSLYLQLSALITKAKQIMIQLRSQQTTRATSMVHPSIVALLVAICGPQLVPAKETDSPQCLII